MWQNLIVGVVVLLAAGYSLWYALPNSARQQLGFKQRVTNKACGSCKRCGPSAVSESSACRSGSSSQIIRFIPRASSGVAGFDGDVDNSARS